jgi:membrane protease YdiL (CAAX protease family)
VDTSTGSINLDLSILQIISAVIEVVVITVVTWPARRFLDRRTFTSLGFHLNRHTLSDLVFGIILGAILMALIFAFESAMGWLDFEAWAWEVEPASQVVVGLVSALILYLAVGYSEELLSRGYHLQNLRDGLNLPLGLLISSAVSGCHRAIQTLIGYPH